MKITHYQGTDSYIVLGNDKFSNAITNLILVAKYTLFKWKIKIIAPSVEMFKNQVMLKAEFFFPQKQKTNKFNEKWSDFASLLED